LENYNEYIFSIGSLKALKDYIFDNKDILGDEKNDLIIALKLDKRVEKTLIKSKDIDYETPYYFNLFKAEQELEIIQFNENIKEEISKKLFNTNKFISYNTYKRCRIIFLKGPEGVGKKFYIKHSCKDEKRHVLFIDMSIFKIKRDNFLELKKEILREVLIENAIPCLCNIDKVEGVEKENKGLLYSLLIELKNISEVIFITSEEDLYEIQESDYFNIVTIEIENPSTEIRSEYWKRCFENQELEVEIDINILVNKFSFTPGQIKLLTNKIKNGYYLDKSTKVNEQVVYDECNKFVSNKLSNLCVFVKPMYTWEDLVLKKDQKEILMQACNHVKYKHIVYNEWKFNEKRAYGNGVCILFTGSPGTGKTMAAQVVANNLNINMYKVDLSAITSKYIGETEKNIKKLFYEAKKSNAVLFFDEADTIFGKRTEVKDSNDKYANMDAAYLLQKIEEYEGISILATNYIQNIDEAFIRRISFIVRFSMPEFNERKLIWEKSFPAAMPLERDLDFDFLANQFQLSGSNIKNIALHSAFLAAANKEGLSMKYVIEAIKTEYLKVNKILMKEDFGPYGDVL
jgi:DNA replication protein DnaC